MAVIFAIVGGGAVVGIATTDVDDHSDYSDYTNYSYDDYSDYSDAAERRQRRLQAKERELREKTSEVNEYKISNINEYLTSETLKEKSGAEVYLSAVRKDGNKTLKDKQAAEIESATADEKSELEAIDRAIEAIDHILDKS